MRADICQFLLQLGLRPDRAHRSNRSPLQKAMSCTLKGKNSCAIDTFRLLIQYSEGTQDFEDEETTYQDDGMPNFIGNSFEAIEWLWFYAETILNRAQLLRLRLELLKECVNKYRDYSTSEEDEELTLKILGLVDTDMREQWLHRRIALLPSLFEYGTSYMDSQRIGSAFLDLLMRLGLDVGACMAMEFHCMRERDVDWSCMIHNRHERTFRFVQSEGCGWVLKWEWNFDPGEPGYLVVSEYPGLGPDDCDSETGYNNGHMWPFACKTQILCGNSDYRGTTEPGRLRERAARFNRRMAAKDRKERTRTGRKRVKSKMPGAWSW